MTEQATGIKFSKAALASFAVIATAGKYLLQCFTNVTEANLVETENGNKKYIATLKAIPMDKLEQIKHTFGDAEEVPIEQTNGLFLTANIWQKPGQETNLPMKGELIECVVDEVPARETGEAVLRVTACRVAPSRRAEKLDVVNFFKKEEAPAQKEIVHA